VLKGTLNKHLKGIEAYDRDQKSGWGGKGQKGDVRTWIFEIQGNNANCRPNSQIGRDEEIKRRVLPKREQGLKKERWGKVWLCLAGKAEQWKIVKCISCRKPKQKRERGIPHKRGVSRWIFK